MANVFLTPTALISATIAHLENDLVLGNNCHLDYSKEFVEVGETIQVERPQRFAGQDDNLDISSYKEDLVGGKFSISLTKTSTIAFEIAAVDRTLSIKSQQVYDKYIEPALIKLKDRIETELANNYWRFPNFYGTPGTTPSTFLDLATPAAYLTEGAIPMTGRCGFHNPLTSATLADGLKGVYVNEKASPALKEATIGRYGGFMNYVSVHMPTHTVGDYGGTPLVAGASQFDNYADVKDQAYSELAIDGGSTSTTGYLKRGDVITIAGVYAINPISKQASDRLQTFTIFEDADTDGSGASTLKVVPQIIVAGTSTGQNAITNNAFATVSATPADNAAITVKTGTANTGYRQSLLMRKEALSLISRPLKIQTNGSFKSKTIMGNKVAIAHSAGGNIDTLKSVDRFDMLFDTTSVNPMHAIRLTS